jgi:hypothetical protein
MFLAGLDWARHTELVEVESRRTSDWTPIETFGCDNFEEKLF